MTDTTAAATREAHDFEYACVWLDCPRCGSHCHYVNIGRGHWGYCEACRVMWMFGSNLFSHWRLETEDAQRARYAELGLDGFEHVEAGWHPDTQRAYEASEFAAGQGGVAPVEDPWPATPALAAARGEAGD